MDDTGFQWSALMAEWDVFKIAPARFAVLAARCRWLRPQPEPPDAGLALTLPEAPNTFLLRSATSRPRRTIGRCMNVPS